MDFDNYDNNYEMKEREQEVEREREQEQERKREEEQEQETNFDEFEDVVVRLEGLEDQQEQAEVNMDLGGTKGEAIVERNGVRDEIPNVRQGYRWH